MPHEPYHMHFKSVKITDIVFDLRKNVPPTRHGIQYANETE